MTNLVLVEVDCRWDDSRCQSAQQSLPPEVQARAQRYRCQRARRSLLASQTVLRQVLDRLGIDQAKLTVCPKGRPYLKDCDLQFNLSHSEHRCVLAFAKDRQLLEALGVDVEWIGRTVERDALAQRFFTQQEYRYTQGSELNFFRVWTRKEAVLKSNGIGLRVPLDSFEVLSDNISPEVTGRGLVLGTQLRAGDYVVSWALASDWAGNQTLWFDTDGENWLDRVAEGITG